MSTKVNTVDFNSQLPMLQSADAFVNNGLEFLRGYYHAEELLQHNANNIVHAAPYKVLYRYEPDTAAYETWGHVYLNGQFERNPELEEFRETAIQKFTEMGKLTGNQAAPRVNDITRVDGGPNAAPTIHMACGNAVYHDQVGTNLVIDWADFAKHNEYGIQTLREYNQKFTQTPDGKLPHLNNSYLANTLGVAVGIVAPLDDRKDSPYVTVMRLRSGNVATYAGMWGPALTFAAKTPPNAGVVNKSLKDFLKFDLAEETLQEIMLKKEELEFVPLALTQDMGRGGKPQLFLEAKSKISLMEMNARLATAEGQSQKQESVGELKTNTTDISGIYSPELIAMNILVQQKYARA